MKKFKWIFAVLSLCSSLAHADTMYQFVRVACVPEAGLLDVESRPLHDSVAGQTGDQARFDALRKLGYYRARGLETSCTLGNVTYLIKASQDDFSERHCGASPDVYLTVTRDGTPFLTGVLFGETCEGEASVQSFTVNEGPNAWRPPQAQVCYLPGKYSQELSCQWLFGLGDFRKRLPIDQSAVARFGEKLKH